MSALAGEWSTDPSNVTWVVDRLERLGLAQRKDAAGDRRKKLVVLTARGAKTKAAVYEAFHDPPPELAALSAKDLRTLCETLARVP